MMLGRQPPAIIGRKQTAFGDCKQGIMRLEILGEWEERLVGRDERQIEAVGEVDHSRLRLKLEVHAVPLDLGLLEDMEQNRDQFELLAESVRSHEKIHTQLLAATWAKADPGVRLDAIVADSENEALGAAVTIISETDERLRAATRDAAVKAKMRKLYGSASAHILLLDSSGAWTPLLRGPVADLGDEERPG